MLYYLYKLNFLTPVHFGADFSGIGLEKASPTCHADTLFSSICCEIIKLYGKEELEKWVNRAKNGDFLISDLFPYSSEDLFLPKPAKTRTRIENKQNITDKLDVSVNKKKMKKLTHIPVLDWDLFLGYLEGNEEKFSLPELKFFEEATIAKVAIPRSQKDNDLYSIGIYKFEDNSGLYFITGFSDESIQPDFLKVLESLGYSGIGGERTSGYGKFTVKGIKLGQKTNSGSEIILFDLLTNKDKEFKMTLSVIAPINKDLLEVDNSYYTLIPRKGFVYSETYNNGIPVKRKPVVMFNAGSCFKNEIEGDILNLQSNEDETHPVWRYGKAMMIGI